ncbi:MAG: hypothetical protein QOI24_729 [Acidobacteriota bacterium]|jgi:membrane-bound metal-dependent hydrolase YbcI (DUF457 family)|nr:hypothetical protein [Acidobacteriota bacterium]
MFIGHNAVGFASKRAAPRVSLGLLMAAPMLLDLIWPILLLGGVEHMRIDAGNTRFTPLDFYDYPWSHSLLMACVWGLLFGGAYFVRTRDRRAGFILFLGVVSHWLFDFFTHRPDLPLWPGGPKVGLGLWNFPAATIVVESLLFIGGVALYVRATRPRDRVGSLGLAAFVLFLVLIYIGNIVGPPPPNVAAVAWLALSAWLLPLWAWWFDAHREARD